MNATTGSPHIDPRNPPYLAIRRLLRDAFSAAELRRLLQDEPDLRLSLYSFSPNDSLDDMIDEIIDYCRSRLLWDELLTAVAEHRPRQYRLFADELGQPKTVSPGVRIPPNSAVGSPPSLSFDERVYDNIEIRLKMETDGNYRAYTESPLRGWSESIPFRSWKAEESRQLLNLLQQGTKDRALGTSVGSTLFQALFDRHTWVRFLDTARKKNSGLRLRLSIDAPELQGLPWELLYDSEAGEFLALAERVLLSRCVPFPRSIPPLGVDPPLRILVVTASPRDHPPLDLDGQTGMLRLALQRLLQRGLVNLNVLHHAQRWPLRDALLRDRPHILHFVGHGDASSDGGALILENEAGLAAPLSGTVLGTLLKRSDVRLVVLNTSAADLTEFSQPRTPPLAVGPALVTGGIGAVVVSQFTFSKSAAQVFARDFYESLARFEAVDKAMAHARIELFLRADQDKLSWAAPVLFTGAPDGVLFLGPDER